MQEKQLSIEDAFQVWWFVMWRTGLTLLVVFFVLNMTARFIDPQMGISQIVINGLALIISIVVQVWFLKSAINRNYNGFRLSAMTPTN